MSKKGFMSQRFTMNDILKPGVRFATQYNISFKENTEDPMSYELIRMKEKYKWKCEELDNFKNQVN